MEPPYCSRSNGGFGWPAIECRRKRLQIAVSLKNECRPVKRICSRPGDDVDDAVAGAAHLRGEARGRNLEFADGVLGQIRQCSAHNFVVVVAAIDGDVAASAKAAGRADLKRIGLGGIEGRRGTIAGKQISQLEKVAAVQRNALDGVFSDLALQHGLCQVDCLVRRCDVHRCHLACGRQGCIERECAAGLEHDARILQPLQSLRADLGAIRPRQQSRNRIDPVRIGEAFACSVLSDACDNNLCSPNYGALGVLYYS